MDNQDARIRSLELAVQSNEDPPGTVERAEQYYKFITKGESV